MPHAARPACSPLACPMSAQLSTHLRPRPCQASASLALHESASCAALLPCGLLPEELAELEELEGGLLQASSVEGGGQRRAAQGGMPWHLRCRCM